jgi:hypothetical protein
VGILGEGNGHCEGHVSTEIFLKPLTFGSSPHLLAELNFLGGDLRQVDSLLNIKSLVLGDLGRKNIYIAEARRSLKTLKFYFTLL